ncbi:DUF3489 domain-containing protein [Phenylobacterium sp.]|uniref:DUF3489 domain-containing protein n=1 Tax=Phenylobacterium sp. TaxID=1871053 RepID=UPI0025E5F77C|nr:DUF3489 domain-containing protein [Phenylobacterium sp.]MBX3485126.1 DUF3489 domain-containing protein [Phenylobacterium sp.]MCW5759193.1 DUF3489 domain-containing protein [Phenylobacterium sp.]
MTQSKASRATRKKKPAEAAATPVPAQTKQARVLAMLRAPGGATVPAIAEATNWQAHSIRGFFTGVVCKKLGLTLVSEPAEGGRIYRVADGDSAA